jgi:phospholipid/cholesterol/gamma-HCH transport system substrate-binding protein
MQKQAPSLGRILTMVLFALSCFGLLLFLWLAFGGPTPLKPQGYRIHVTFPEAGQLAQEADVRISGVSVGRVTKLTASKDGTTDAVVQLDAAHAPLAKDARAILRQKTLLGETYVELTPGRPNTPTIPENGRMAAGNVAPTVELDEILSAFDPKTRAAFQTWVQTVAVAAAGRGRGLSDALGTLPPFEENTGELLTLLNSQEGAVRQLVANTGTVFDSISARTGQLSGLIRNANTVFATTAQRDQALQATFVALPTFEQESTATLKRLDEFADNTNPLVDELKPAARELTPTLAELDTLAPTLKTLFTNVGPVITAAEKGLPAVRSVLSSLQPLLPAFDQPLRQLTPIFEGLGYYKHELTAFFANSAAATNAVGRRADGQPTTERLRYLRTTNPFSPENLTGFQTRIRSNRTSPYTYPEAFAPAEIKAGLQSYDTRGCSNFEPALGGNDAAGFALVPEALRNQIVQQAFLGSDTGANVVAPRCVQQSQFPILPTGQGGATLTTYPHVEASTSPVARR